jgi:hypothetical protein
MVSNDTSPKSIAKKYLYEEIEQILQISQVESEDEMKSEE